MDIKLILLVVLLGFLLMNAIVIYTILRDRKAYK